ncbi:MAG: molybdopterin-dependent oxidoreductase [Hydrogenibacillus sp.]|nr:molybdopterin-dependent oxidoreductase [Hydrogenibacillus sp.]
MIEKRSACPLNCFDGCSMRAVVVGGRIVSLSGNPEHPITRGIICGKGRALLGRHEHPERLLKPLKKVDGRFVPIDWSQALDEIAERIQAALSRFGPTSVFYSYDYANSGLMTLLEERLFNRLGGMTKVVGTLCWSAGIAAQSLDFGESRTSDPELLKEARAIVVWGRNVAVTNMHLVPFIREAKRHGAKLVVIDPYPQALARQADLVVRVRPGKDGALAVALAQALLQTGAVDRTFVERHADGFEAYRTRVEEADRQELLAAAGVDEAHFDALVRLFAAPPIRVILGYGLQRYQSGGATIRAIDALVALTGSIGRAGGGVDYAHTVLGKMIDQEAVTRPDWRRAYRTVTRANQAEELPLLDPPPKVLYVTRANPLAQAPNAAKLQEVYEAIPTKIVVELFMTETAKIADYVLPAADVFEQADIYYSSMWHGYLQYAEALVPPRGEARPERWIVRELARRLGAGDAFNLSDEDVWRLALGRRLDDAGWRELFRRGFVRLTPERVAWAERKFATPNGRFQFAPPPIERWLEAEAESTASFGEGRKTAYRLLTVHPRRSLHGQHRVLSASEPTVYAAPEVLEREGLADGALVWLNNAQGRLLSRLRALPGLVAEALVMEEGTSSQTVNVLVPGALADLGQGSTQYDCRVTIEAARGARSVSGNDDRPMADCARKESKR